MKFLSRAFALCAVLVLLLASGCSAARPLHRSTAGIRASILKKTPPGTTKKDVEAFIAKEGWRPMDIRGRGPEPNEIQVRFGGYAVFFGTCNVYGLWEFDNDGRLLDLRVSKERDVL